MVEQKMIEIRRCCINEVRGRSLDNLERNRSCEVYYAAKEHDSMTDSVEALWSKSVGSSGGRVESARCVMEQTCPFQIGFSGTDHARLVGVTMLSRAK